MEWTVSYILSQVFTIIMYILLGITYFAKNRKNVLIISFLSLVSNSIAYIFLSAWSGFAMCIVAIIRNIIFLVDENRNGKRDKINKKDIIILIVLQLISIVFAILTYDGIFSMLIVFATMLYTYSVWQKSTKLYKFLGIPIGLLLIAYNVYVMSLFGIILESILLIASTSGYILELRNINKKQK